MAGRRGGRAGRNDALTALIVIAVVVVLIGVAINTGGSGDWGNSGLAFSAALIVTGGYLGFVLPRQCGGERAVRPGPCGRRAHGVLNGCRTHPFAGLRQLLGRPTTVHDSGQADPVYGRPKTKPAISTSAATIVVKDSPLMKYIAVGQLVVGVLGVAVSALAL